MKNTKWPGCSFNQFNETFSVFPGRSILSLGIQNSKSAEPKVMGSGNKLLPACIIKDNGKNLSYFQP
jgi:hypothetical protein